MTGKFEELVVVLLIVLVLFGGKKVPELARSIGTAIKEVRHGFRDDDAAVKPATQPSKKTGN